MTDVFKAPVVTFNDEGQPTCYGLPRWSLAIHGNVISLNEGDFAIAINVGCFDPGSKGVVTVSCVMSPDVGVVPFSIETADYASPINAAIKLALTEYMSPHDWVVE
mgnify:CR=1 FL=1